MNAKEFVIRRQKLIKEITKLFYQREALNSKIKNLKDEMNGLDRVLLNDEIK